MKRHRLEACFSKIRRAAVLCLSRTLTELEGRQRPAQDNSSRLTTMKPMKLTVECYSGRKADERPVRFRLGERQYQVEAVLDQWYDPESVFYKIQADDGNLYILRQQTSTPDGQWELVSFRRAG